MPFSAPIRVPVEITPAQGHASDEASRLFRLATDVAVDRLVLGGGLPEELEWLSGPLRLAFHLPGDAAVINCVARAAEVLVDEGCEQERAERRLLVFEDLPSDAADRVGQYVEERLQQR